MDSETPFRIAIVAVLFPIFLLGSYHRLQAAKSGEKISHREEGYLFAAMLRLSALVAAVVVSTYLLAPERVAWAHIPLPAPVRWVSIAVGFGCSGLMYWTLSTLGRNLTDTVVTRSNATLVTHGPYGWVRHPFYVTGTLLLISIAGIAANWLVFLCGAVPFVLLAIRTPKEEQMLLARFGESYQNYCERTGRFIPRFHGQNAATTSRRPQDHDA